MISMIYNQVSVKENFKSKLTKMKNIFFLLSAFILFKCSFAQWTNGTNIYNSNSGNVGVGTTSPDYKLTVNGTFGLQYNGTLKYHMGYLNGGFNVAESGVLDYRLFIKDGGNVGIGTSNPETLLHVNGNSRFNGSGWFQRNNNGSAGVALNLGQNSGWDYPAVQISTADNGGTSYSSWFGSRWAHYMDFSRSSSVGTKNIFEIGGSDGEQYVCVYSVDGTTPKIKFSADGTSFLQSKLVIGTTTLPTGYSFAVNGDAIFTKIKVKQYPWADYVFNIDYKLPPLTEVEAYIKKYKHLRDVPSAKDVEQNGLNLGDNQATLLKKIEELTLYIIEQDKKMQEQNKKIDSQQKQINDLKSQNKELQDIKKELEIIKAKLQN